MENKQKRVPKGDIKFKMQLSEEQKEVKKSVWEKDVTFVLGKAGSGKTAVAAQIALDLLFKRRVNKIIIARPLNFDATGYLKGSINEKLEFHLSPIIQNFYASYDSKAIDKMIEEKEIQIFPIEYMRGITFEDAVTIIDEVNEMNFIDFTLTLSRLGKHSKLIYTGSLEQIRPGYNSCLYEIVKLQDCEEIGFHVLTSNHRNDIIYKVLDHIELKNIQNETIDGTKIKRDFKTDILQRLVG